MDKVKDRWFWYKEGEKVGFEMTEMMEFLQENGINRYYLGTTEYIYVKSKNNIVEQIDIAYIKNFLMKYVMDKGDVSVKRSFERQINTLTSNSTMMLLKELEIPFFMDKKDEAHFFYKDNIIKLSKGSDEAECIEYSQFNQPIWKSHIIPRNSPKEFKGETEFLKFLRNVFADEKSLRLIQQSIGYLLHNHKNRAFMPVVILTDDNTSDETRGGTGKGIILQAIGKYLNITMEDGKKFDPRDRFSYQNVELDTKALVIEDAKRNFQFENLFSVITDGVPVEKKGESKYHIPFERSPKIIMTTNYAVDGNTHSHIRRRVDIALSPYYDSNRTPLDEFRHLLFDDWSEEEWERFDFIMLSCVQLYLDEGVQRVPNENLKIKQLKSETHPDFEDWLSRIERDTIHSKGELIKLWTQESNDKVPITKRKLTKWISKYQDIQNFELISDRNNDTYMLKSK